MLVSDTSKIARHVALRLWLALFVGAVAAATPLRLAVADEDAATESAEPDVGVVQTVSGLISSSTLAYQESGSSAIEITPDGARPETASSFRRLFSDLRLRVDARHIAGGAWDARIDARARQVLRTEAEPEPTTVDSIPIQSGTFGTSEYELRELFIARRGDRVEVDAGRQIVPEVAATKVDGLRLSYRGAGSWRYTGFAGLYPQRGSRSLADDYPTLPADAADAEQGERILPVAAGMGGAYRLENFYGNVGMAGIWTRTDDPVTGLPDVPRVFVTSSGYWTSTKGLDLFHYAVLDLEGSAGTGLTNLSLGVDYRPVDDLHLTAQLTRIDTETLAATARTRLEHRDDLGGDRIQNAVALTRIASEAARLGVSAALAGGRFQLSTSGSLRRRPDTAITTSEDGEYVFPRTQLAEIDVSAVDRRSILGLRLALTFAGIFGVGEEPGSPRSSSRMVRLSGRHVFGARKSELEVDASYLASEDEGSLEAQTCSSDDPLLCYGTASARTVQVGALLFHRLHQSWSLIASLHVGQQALNSADLTGSRFERPAVLAGTGFLRVAYRF